jgi:hypothetical protein
MRFLVTSNLKVRRRGVFHVPPDPVVSTTGFPLTFFTFSACESKFAAVVFTSLIVGLTPWSMSRIIPRRKAPSSE